MEDERKTDLEFKIKSLIAEYIKLYGCGDPECETCKLGVAIGLEALDAAYNAGAAAMKGA